MLAEFPFLWLMFILSVFGKSFLWKGKRQLCPCAQQKSRQWFRCKYYMKKKNPNPEGRGFSPNRKVPNKDIQQDLREFQETEQSRSEQLIEETLGKFGVVKRPHFSKEGHEKLGPYDRLVAQFGAETLQFFEKGLLWTSSFLVFVLVLSGIVLSVDAFLHSSLERESSSNFTLATTNFVDEATVNVIQPLFTPLILLFFFASISLGILKSLQLTSSKTVYRE